MGNNNRRQRHGLEQEGTQEPRHTAEASLVVHSEVVLLSELEEPEACNGNAIQLRLETTSQLQTLVA